MSTTRTDTGIRMIMSMLPGAVRAGSAGRTSLCAAEALAASSCGDIVSSAANSCSKAAWPASVIGFDMSCLAR